MNKEYLKKLFPGLEDELYDELLLHGTTKEIKAGAIILRVGQTICSTTLLLDA